jgi:hypothetical protein
VWHVDVYVHLCEIYTNPSLVPRLSIWLPHYLYSSSLRQRGQNWFLELTSSSPRPSLSSYSRHGQWVVDGLRYQLLVFPWPGFFDPDDRVSGNVEELIKDPSIIAVVSESCAYHGGPRKGVGWRQEEGISAVVRAWVRLGSWKLTAANLPPPATYCRTPPPAGVCLSAAPQGSSWLAQLP